MTGGKIAAALVGLGMVVVFFFGVRYYMSLQKCYCRQS